MACFYKNLFKNEFNVSYFDFLVGEKEEQVFKLLKNIILPDVSTLTQTSFEKLCDFNPAVALISHVALMLYHPQVDTKLKLIVVIDNKRWVNLQYLCGVFLAYNAFFSEQLLDIKDEKIFRQQGNETTATSGALNLVANEIVDAFSTFDRLARRRPQESLLFFKNFFKRAYAGFPISLSKISTPADLFRNREIGVYEDGSGKIDSMLITKLLLENCDKIDWLVEYNSIFDSSAIVRSLFVNLLNENIISPPEAIVFTKFYFWGALIKSYSLSQTSDDIKTFKYYVCLLKDTGFFCERLAALVDHLEDLSGIAVLELRRFKSQNNFYFVIYEPSKPPYRFSIDNISKLFPNDGPNWSAIYKEPIDKP